MTELLELEAKSRMEITDGVHTLKETGENKFLFYRNDGRKMTKATPILFVARYLVEKDKEEGVPSGYKIHYKWVDNKHTALKIALSAVQDEQKISADTIKVQNIFQRAR